MHWLNWITLTVIILANYLVFIWVPLEKVMGAVQKIFYFHVATAWVGFFAFFVVFIFSIFYLITKNERWDRYSAASAEIGVVFISIVILTGAIWGRAFWGQWWTWDPRLTTSLVLWFIYIAYLLFRSAIEEREKKASLSAILGIIGFLDVPVVWFSIRWWRTIHPNLMETGGKMAISPKMGVTLLLAILAFTLLYILLMTRIISLQKLADEIYRLKEEIRSHWI
ncbi:MAG: heme exporter protein [Clostridia bacterium]|nr:heme exporter protein [Clostridia bacterium]MDN5322380.1 heme exporter protein [Clostridia bacterium]